MVNARIHIICGNCGCGDMFEGKTEHYSDGEFEGEEIYITCKNCSTIHSLSDKMEISRFKNDK
jgi:hypothetical protein